MKTMKNKKNKKNKTQREQKERTIGARFKEAAEGFKERAKSMTSEEQAKQTQESEQPENQQPEQEACEVDIKALQEELEKAKAQSDEYLDLAQRKQAEFANYRRRTEGIRAEPTTTDAGTRLPSCCRWLTTLNVRLPQRERKKTR